MRRLRPIAPLLFALTLAATLAAPRPAEAQDGAIHVLIVAGLGGTSEFRERFHAEASGLRAALVERHGIPESNVVYLGEDADAHPGEVDDRSTRANVLRVLGEIAQRAAPSDRVLVVLIGHGTADRGEARFNLPGPDLGPEDFQSGLGAFPSQTLALVHTGSASGGFLEPLSGPNRVIITATRSPQERNATEFAQYFVEALASDGADLDHDGQVSLLETFEYARGEVARHYTEENQILTEHAVLDDDGDGQGSREASADGPDGRLAATFRVAALPGSATDVADDPVLARLYEERAEIQERIAQLRASRDARSADRYDEELEALLIELALKSREIREHGGGG